MNDTHKRLIEIGQKILTVSRNELYVSMRFLDIALSRLRYDMNLSSLYVGTDGKKILFNPRHLTQLYLSDRVLINRLYLHMVLHCLFRHPFHQNKREERYWHLACDIAVESMIDTLPIRCVQLVVSDIRQQWYDKLHRTLKVLTAEGIYEILVKENLSPSAFGKLQMAFWVDDHVFWEKEQQEEESEQNNQQQNQEQNQQQNQEQNQQQQELEQQWRDVSEKIQTNLETLQIGTDIGALLHYLRIENRERYDYRAFLQKFATIREDMRVDDDSYDYIFYTYGLQLYGNLPLIEALEYKEVQKIEELVIAIDTSESCEGDTVKKFLEETYSILQQQESFFHKCNIHIVQCDTQIQQDYRITCQEDLQRYMQNFALHGNGGTDFRPVFTYVSELMEQNTFQNLKGLIYFTDGWGQFPKHRPPYQTAFVFLDDGMYNEKDVPPWAMKVILGKEEIEILETKGESRL